MSQSGVSHTLFLIYRDSAGELSEADLGLAASVASRLRGLASGLAFAPVPVEGKHPFVNDGPGPQLVLQLDFGAADDLDAALSADGPLAEIVRPGAMPSLPGAVVGYQRMLGRRFPVPDPLFNLAPGGRPCTFLVEYPGSIPDLDAWLDHYDVHHPPIMARFPGIRDVATFRPTPPGDALPCERLASMQRNKVVFDSAAALVAALNSPVMQEMRADAATFPPSSRRPTHHAMATHRLPRVDIAF